MSDRLIKEAIERLSGTKGRDAVQLLECSVVSVDVDSRTCECKTINSAAEFNIPNVRLTAVVDDGMLIIPVVGSTVIVAHSNTNLSYVSQFSEIEKVLIITGDSSVEIKDGLIKLNDGSFDGLVKIAELVDKLNNIENLLNQLITTYNSHVHASNGTPTTSLVTQTLTPTQQQDLENTKVTHGE